jgi:PAS domain S-box-containing protein
MAQAAFVALPPPAVIAVAAGDAALPWIILAAGLALAGLAGVLGLHAARRAKAQDDLDRIFNLSPDLAAVADFEGHFTRVNPAVENVLGYTPEEFLATPYAELVHPDDRERTEREAAAIAQGKRTLQFTNRYRHKDGSYRTLEWTSTPVVEDGLMYGVARDVTERRAAENKLALLADEQTALRRVATAVAKGCTPEQVFAVVAEEVARLLGTDSGTVDRYLGDAECTVVGSWGRLGEAFPVGSRWRLDDLSCSSLVYRTRRPARLESYEEMPGDVAHEAHKVGVRSAVGSPIVVEGRLWGALVAGTSSPEPLPPDAEVRIAQFTGLVATAISNVQARAEVERLADGQAALRRVAELVAREAPQAEVFRAIAVEIGRLFGTEEIRMWRYEPHGESATVVGTVGSEAAFPLGVRHDLSGDSAVARVLRTGRPSRLDSYASAPGRVADTARAIGVRSTVGVPILVEGRLWGAMVTGSTQPEPLPPGTEARLEEFTELLATTIANTEARTELERLAQEQAALRRVATLVAEGGSPRTVLDAVAGEMESLLNADQVALNRFDSGDQILVMAHRGLDVERTPVGSRVSIAGQSATATVRRTARPARMEHYETAEGPLAELARETGLRSSVSAPIVVDGRLWGLITASWKREEPPPPDTEERMAKFAELLDTAIANADTRAQLSASRARLVTEADEARRRVVRDLHDGAQQRLVHTIVTLKLAKRAGANGDRKLESLIDEALQHAERGNSELRELAHGILPSVLTGGGLIAAVGTVVERIDLPVQVEVPSERFPAEIEASAYFIVAEALTNVVKHSHATRAEVTASVQDGALLVQVQDDGVGGADPSGHGLVGMNDRVTALGGRLDIESPAGGGTIVTATLPLAR